MYTKQTVLCSMREDRENAPAVFEGGAPGGWKNQKRLPEGGDTKDGIEKDKISVCRDGQAAEAALLLHEMFPLELCLVVKGLLQV